MTANDWHFVRTAGALAGAVLFIIVIIGVFDWVESKVRDWSKKRLGESSLTYRILFYSPFTAVRPFYLPDHLSRQQADRLYRLPWFIFLSLPFVSQTLSSPTREAVVAFVSLFATLSIFYFLSWRKHFKTDPNYKHRFSPFRFLAEKRGWSREKADRTFLQGVPVFIAVMLATVPIQRIIFGEEFAEFSKRINIVMLPLVGLPSLFYVFKRGKLFSPAGDDSPFAFLHDPQRRRAAAHSIAKTVVPLLVFGSLIVIFVPDDPQNPLSRLTVLILFWGSLAFIISLPSMMTHSWVRDTVFGSRHRFLVAFFAWLVPPTLMYLARYPAGMQKDLEFAPVLSSVWFFTSFCGAAILAYAMLSGKAPKTHSTESMLVGDSQRLDAEDERRIRSLRRRRLYREIFGFVAGIASIFGLIWSVVSAMP